LGHSNPGSKAPYKKFAVFSDTCNGDLYFSMPRNLREEIEKYQLMTLLKRWKREKTATFHTFHPLPNSSTMAVIQVDFG
jgi:hypothetical protein